jgi:eukaryotic-like serine/threonine-protein kinase
MALEIGDVLRDTYRIDALIGRGGMGQVFAATALRDPSIGQVAIKVLSRLFVDDVMIKRLHREAEAASRIRSEHIPRVYEIVEAGDGETALVMERLVGESLSDRLREHVLLPWSEVLFIGEDVLRGLVDAHLAGVIHRDLKPSNVYLARQDGRARAMILDFGVCKLDGVDTARLTGTGESIGTVAYMAPEQIRGASQVDERADLFAFGVLVFEMLTGKLPHEGPSQMAILASKLENAPARLAENTGVAIPDGLEAMIARTLHRDPAMRFSSAQELLQAWRALAAPTIEPSTTPPPARMPRDDDTERDITENISDITLNDDAPTEFLPPLGRPALDPTPAPPAVAAPVSKRAGPPQGIAVAVAIGVALGLLIVTFAFMRSRARADAARVEASARQGVPTLANTEASAVLTTGPSAPAAASAPIAIARPAPSAATPPAAAPASAASATGESAPVASESAAVAAAPTRAETKPRVRRTHAPAQTAATSAQTATTSDEPKPTATSPAKFTTEPRY